MGGIYWGEFIGKRNIFGYKKSDADEADEAFSEILKSH